MHKISLATQSLWDRSLEEAVTLAARVGYDGVEIVCHDPILPLPELRRLRDSLPAKLRALHLEVPSLTIVTHFTSPNTISHNMSFLNAVVDLAEPYGTRLVKMSPGPPVSSEATPEQWRLAVQCIRESADHAQDRGVALALETHLGQLADVEQSTLRLLQDIDHPNVGVVLDWCNVMVMGGDPVNAIRLLAPHLRLIHAKDGHMTAGAPRWDPIGQGALDYPQLLATPAETGYSGFLSVEALVKDPRYDITNRPTDPQDNNTRDLPTLRRHLQEHEGLYTLTSSPNPFILEYSRSPAAAPSATP